MKKILVRIGVVIGVLLVVGYFSRNFIARKSVEIGVKKVTGFPLEIGSVDVGVFTGTLEVRNLKLMNPPEFHGGLFVDLPAFKVDYKTLSMLTGSPHIKEVLVNVEQVVLVKNEKGETNADVLQAKVSPPSTEAPQPGGGGGGQPKDEGKTKYQVDLVRVHIGSVIKRVYSSKGPSETKITLNRDVEIKDMNESTSITALVMKVMLGPVGDVAGDLVKGVGGAVKNAGDTVGKTGKGLFDSIKKTVPQK